MQTPHAIWLVMWATLALYAPVVRAAPVAETVAPAPPAADAPPTGQTTVPPVAETESPAPPTPATCGEDSREEHPPWGRVFVSRFYGKQTFTPRAAPAEPLRATEPQVMQQGFVAIAWVEVTRFTLLHKSSLPDEPIPGPAGTLAAALEQAGQLGGDAFTLFNPEEPATEWARTAGSGSDATRTGTTVKGTVWRRSRSQSRAQLLVYAAQHGHTEIVERLLRARVPVDTREPRFCQTSLIAAAQAGQSAVVQRLLSAGASRELTDTFGTTALGYAAFPHQFSSRKCECAQLLRKSGAKEPAAPRGHFSFDFPAPKRCPR